MIVNLVSILMIAPSTMTIYKILGEYVQTVLNLMASRKSCTHLTWAEAKASIGTSNKAGGKSKKQNFKKVDHAKALVAKTVAKNISQEDMDREKAMLRRERKAEERAAVAAAKRAEEKERERMERFVKPFEVANEQMSEKARKLQEECGPDLQTITSNLSPVDMKRVAECCDLQLNEVMGLEAIYSDTNELLVSHASDVETLQRYIDQWQMENDNDELLHSILHHPNLSFTFQITVDGICDAMNMTALLLLKVTFPKLYPLDESVTPEFSIQYFTATDREAVCNPDKQIETLAHLEESKLKDALEEEAKKILPDPCVYEVVSSWLVERLFDYLAISVHAQMSLLS